jgi:hypothetical protein
MKCRKAVIDLIRTSQADRRDGDVQGHLGHRFRSPESIDGVDEAVLECLLGRDADVAQDRAGEFGKETLDGIERGAVITFVESII